MKKIILFLILLFSPLFSFAYTISIDPASSTPPLADGVFTVSGINGATSELFVIVNPTAPAWTNTWDQNCSYITGTVFNNAGGVINPADFANTGCDDNLDEEGTWYMECYNGASCSNRIAFGLVASETGSTTTATSTVDTTGISLGIGFFLFLYSGHLIMEYFKR